MKPKTSEQKSSKKRGGIFGKKHILAAAMALALGLAVWLNMKYASEASGFRAASTDKTGSVIGEAQFVEGSEKDSSAVETSAKESYFASAKSKRESARKEATELLEDTVNSAKTSDDEKKAAVEQLSKTAKNQEDEAAIETLIKAKGFSDAVAVIGDDGISVVVKSEKLLQSESLQIQDIVTSQTGIALEKIKIIAVK